ncbi:unnamed protein product [Paramecium pentaurelia]|uniref:Uncharacterized protein n=1 Tax=Paramecium pentaurelia TaxID=43138 RepID=A0A8S1Y1Y9_9CILI|nr:unnamed protein product [Paramecium pentaurelia]
MNSKFHFTLLMIAILSGNFGFDYSLPCLSMSFSSVSYFIFLQQIVNLWDQKLKNNYYNVVFMLFCCCNFDQMIIEIYNQKLMINY